MARTTNPDGYPTFSPQEIRDALLDDLGPHNADAFYKSIREEIAKKEMHCLAQKVMNVYSVRMQQTTRDIITAQAIEISAYISRLVLPDSDGGEFYNEACKVADMMLRDKNTSVSELADMTWQRVMFSQMEIGE